MKKISRLLTASFFVLLVSAVLVFPYSVAAQVIEKTVVDGQVTDQSHNPVNGANVTIICNGNTEYETTGSDGKYQHIFTGLECPVGTTVTAQATSGSGSGSGSAPVQVLYNNGSVQINIALINITVPEFGLITGLFTAITSVGAFLMLKKRIV